MAEKPEDFALPNAVVTKLIKDALPEGVVVSKDAKAALGKATSIFILYATSVTTQAAASNNRKSLAPQDVLNAINEMGFPQFIPELNRYHEAHKKEKVKKDKLRAKARAEKASNTHSPGQSSRMSGGDSQQHSVTESVEDYDSQDHEPQIVYESVADNYL